MYYSKYWYSTKKLEYLNKLWDFHNLLLNQFINSVADSQPKNRQIIIRNVWNKLKYLLWTKQHVQYYEICHCCSSQALPPFITGSSWPSRTSVWSWTPGLESCRKATDLWSWSWSRSVFWPTEILINKWSGVKHKPWWCHKDMTH